MQILVLAANPEDQTQLRLAQEVREIEQRLQLVGGHGLEIVSRGAVKVRDLQFLLQNNQAEIVHFSGHGTEEGELLLEDNNNQSAPVPMNALTKAFEKLRGNIRCVVLNSCYSEGQARAIAKSIDCVIGMSSAVYDGAAIAFAASFYQALAFGQSVQTAFDLGRDEVDLHKIPGGEQPALHPRKGVKAANVFLSGRPEVHAEFVLHNGKPVKSDGEYEICMFVKNASRAVRSVVYQLRDEEFADIDEEFEEIFERGKKGFETSFYADGDFPIRAALWEEDRCHGVATTLVEALERTFGPRSRGVIGKALQSISDN